jgi:hypothetical protein
MSLSVFLAMFTPPIVNKTLLRPLSDRTQDVRFQVSAPPPAKKAAGLIENKTLHWGLINLIMAIYEILIVGAASSRDDVTIGMKGAFLRLEAAPTRT